ncbi:MAG: hypothetical protein IRZ33_09435, partial [Alicyclobacillaceae bacterium]|nr:hypothetical protein [Alicyclobacillaceae bacterium]
MSEGQRDARPGQPSGPGYALGGRHPAQYVVATTPWHPGPAARERAALLADWFQCRLVERGRRSVRRLLAEEQAEVAVVADCPPKLYHCLDPDTPLFFHPGLALQRIAQWRSGQPDRLLRAGRVQTGDRVVDGTLGLGADSLVLAAAVGAEGRVVAVESSWCLARLFTFSARTAVQEYPVLAELFPRIQVIVG